MIEFIDLNREQPYKIFLNKYQHALEKKQKNIEAIAISSFNPKTDEVESRFVNLKYIKDDQWIFFSNYNSNKAKNFAGHNQITGLFFWHQTNTQVRIKATLQKTQPDFSDWHFSQRTKEKNALAISSKQSQKIDSFESIRRGYEEVIKDEELLHQRPDYWGGYSFVPYYFEFWEGQKFRLNKREVFEFDDNKWKTYLLQP